MNCLVIGGIAGDVMRSPGIDLLRRLMTSSYVFIEPEALACSQDRIH